MTAIRILVTGGTFDKEYDMMTGRLYFQDTHLREIFEIGRCNLNVKIRTLMMIDSLDMTDEDREAIVHNCKNSQENRIVITHGTDTMSNTAELIAKEKIDKTIVLTGALIPYKFGASDAFFNLGSSLAFAQTLPSGVFISMHGRYFEAGSVEKNRDTGFFEPLVNKIK